MNEKGFTLIELMIVVAIIGLLAMIAVPSYLDYTVKTRVGNGISFAQKAKFAVSETIISTNSFPANQAATGYESPIPTEDLTSVVIAGDGSGKITLTFPVSAGNGTLVMTPSIMANGDVTWDCTGGTLLSKYRPSQCRP